MAFKKGGKFALELGEERTETHACDCISRADVEQTVEDNILCYTHSERPIDQDPDTECHMAIRTALRMLRKDLRKLPPAQPEIIHCHECRWRKDQSGSTAWLPCRAIVTPSDFYCSRAERRTDE